MGLTTVQRYCAACDCCWKISGKATLPSTLVTVRWFWHASSCHRLHVQFITSAHSIVAWACSQRRLCLFVGWLVGLFVCLSVLPHDIAKNDAAKVTVLDIWMFNHESCKTFILGSKSQGQEAQKHCWRGSSQCFNFWLTRPISDYLYLSTRYSHYPSLFHLC